MQERLLHKRDTYVHWDASSSVSVYNSHDIVHLPQCGPFRSYLLMLYISDHFQQRLTRMQNHDAPSNRMHTMSLTCMCGPFIQTECLHMQQRLMD